MMQPAQKHPARVEVGIDLDGALESVYRGIVVARIGQRKTEITMRRKGVIV
jgi:hypothetical protein